LVCSKSQTLVTGVYRTGSEYLSQLIGCHPKINVTMYTVNVLRFIYNRYDPISERVNYQSAIYTLADRLKARYNRLLDKEKILDDLARCECVDYGVFYDTVMSSLYLRAPAEHWAEKNQLLWREIPTFLEMMPNGKAILTVRDPRSVLLSFKKYTYAPPPAYLGAVFNCLDAMQHGLEYQRKYPYRFFCVRYEDAARSPAQTVRRFWNFLELEGSFDCCDQSNWTDEKGDAWHTNSVFHPNEDLRPFDVEASINRWRSELDDEEISFVEAVCGKTMHKYGYAPGRDEYDWLSVMRLFAHDDTISNYFRQWLLTGEGIEAFPTDPLDPKNWAEARERLAEKQNA